MRGRFKSDERFLLRIDTRRDKVLEVRMSAKEMRPTYFFQIKWQKI